nr:hypothetical protein [Bacillus nakamurai]
MGIAVLAALIFVLTLVFVIGSTSEKGKTLMSIMSHPSWAG